MKLLEALIALMALAMLLICIPMIASAEETVEATTAIALPVDSITIYPDGLVSVKNAGNLEVTEGVHKFVVSIPDLADKGSVLLSVTNATIERMVYDNSPVYTLNFSYPGSQSFALSYLMNYAGEWAPMYYLHLANDSVKISANAIVQNRGGEDLKNVRIKLVAGLPTNVEQYYAKRAMQINNYAGAALANAAAPAPAPAENTGDLETLYIFELPGRKDLEMNKKVAFPLFEEVAPLVRIYTWDAYVSENGPAVEEIRANNTLTSPWPSGQAMIYKGDDYVSTITMPYTPAGTNASINLGSSPDVKVSKKLKDYNITENVKEIGSSGNISHAVKETTEKWKYQLKVENNLDRRAVLEVSDTRPKESKIISISIQPTEMTATGLKWRISLAPKEKTTIDYEYQVVTVKSLDTLV
ncbi:MAG: DUF4139 domain-containing protein [Methanotrichaceae archaeon]